MLTFDLEHLFSVKKKHGLSQKDLDKKAVRLPVFLKRIHAKKQGFYHVVDDAEMVKDIQEFTKKRKGNYAHIVVLGIGGSSLGTTCLQQSLGHLFAHEKKDTTPTLHVLDNIDPILIEEIQDVIDIQKTLFIVVSKSGTTPEILSQYMFFTNKLKRAKMDLKNHLIFVTDPEQGLLVDVAAKEGITTFSIPPNVGGRFSVLTPVGLLPAALMGYDISALLHGAREMRNLFLSEKMNENLPFQLAAIQFLLYKKGKVMHVMMPYAQKLIRFADWYRQLLAESIGKAKDKAGRIVHVGITPINALGATDQHSQSQLYNEGPLDKFFIFIRVKKLGKKRLAIPALFPKDERTHFLKGASFQDLIDAEYRATAAAYAQNDRPSITVEIDQVGAYQLGQLFMLFEGATAFLGEFFSINAYDQPGVEQAKILTKQYLERQR